MHLLIANSHSQEHMQIMYICNDNNFFDSLIPHARSLFDGQLWSSDGR